MPDVSTLSNGVVMPALGLGVFQTPPDETGAAMSAALKAGYRHIDIAAAYGNERQVGEAVASSGLDQSEVFLETKIWISDYGYDETLHGFNFMVDHLTTLLDNASVVPAVNQIEVHPYFTQPKVQALNAAHGILTQVWSPIGGVTLYGDRHTSTLQDPTISHIARAHGKTPAQVMLRWHLQQGRSVIPKSTKPARIAENIDVFDFDLTTGELAAIDALDTGQRGGPEPETITLETDGRPIPEA
jgi:diketogulonate reductase-like aldo/keto reductase